MSDPKTDCLIIAEKYRELLDRYGPQGWWPINGQYHPGEYNWPQTKNHLFEICLGAILTQNTNWKSAATALQNLRQLQVINALKLIKLEDGKLKAAIRPSGYFNQKCTYLKTFAKFFATQSETHPTRETLLRLRGIGSETADSMLLYGWHQPYFVVDAYTRRVFSDTGVFTPKESYGSIQQKFHTALAPLYSSRQLIQVYQEYHALIVRHAKHLSSRQLRRDEIKYDL